MDFVTAAAIAASAASVAWAARALTSVGALAAWSVGTAVLAGTGWAGGAVLAAFFVSSTVVGRFAVWQTGPRGDAKGERRDAWQVYANGGVAAAGALVGWGKPSLAIWLVTGSLAAAAADTWATAVGSLSPRPPRRLGFGPEVPPGTSGGMTIIGTAGGLVGAIVVASTGALATDRSILLPAATVIGFGGMVADSIIGAVLQGHFYCSVCRTPTERRSHACGARATRRGGIPWLTNDGVNFLSTAAAGWAAAIAWRTAL